jgi:hypothetical protein
MRLDGSVLCSILTVSCASTLVCRPPGEPRGSRFQHHRFQPSHRSQSRLARLDQITPRLNELDLGLDQLSLRIENVQQALLAEALLLSNAGGGLSPSFRLI